MIDDGTISSFGEAGYTNGRCRLVFSENLAQHADEWDKEQGNAAEPGFATSRVLLTVLENAILAKASYVHFDPVQGGRKSSGEFRVRYRINGRLWEADAFPLHGYSAFGAMLKIDSSANPAERRVPQFGRFLWVQAGAYYEMRLSSIPTQSGEAFVINILKIVGHGNYTEERHEWLDKLTAEDIYANILAKRQEKTR